MADGLKLFQDLLLLVVCTDANKSPAGLALAAPEQIFPGAVQSFELLTIARVAYKSEAHAGRPGALKDARKCCCATMCAVGRQHFASCDHVSGEVEILWVCTVLCWTPTMIQGAFSQ